jgi:hypothetical protein
VNRGAIVGAWLALTLLGGAPAGATSTVPVAVEALTRRADDVVLAVARRSNARWDGRVIVTDTELEVTAVLRGRLVPRSAVLVTTPGGVVGRIGQVVPGTPVFTEGGAYVLFLQPGPAPLRYLAHLTAAVVPVRVGATGEVLVDVPRDLWLPPEGTSGTWGPLVTGAQAPVGVPPGAAVTVPLERLVRAIQGTPR